MLNPYEEAIIRNARWFVAREDRSGFIDVPADEYYGIRGDASLIGHAMSVRTMGWVLTGDAALLESARRSAELAGGAPGPTRRLAPRRRLLARRGAVRLRGLLHLRAPDWRSPLP